MPPPAAVLTRPTPAATGAAPATATATAVPVTHPALRRAAALLDEAAAGEPGDRFALARLAALTTAWAACSGHVDEDTRAHAAGPWALLVLCRPGLSPWAAAFVPAETRWAAVCRGGRVGGGPADDLLTRARAFHVAVTRDRAGRT